jgi:hypothetical protein
MKLSALIIITVFANSAFAWVTCESEAAAAAKALARINQSHARIVVSSVESPEGDKVEVVMDNKIGGQSVTYTATIVGNEPCVIAKIEITGEE